MGFLICQLQVSIYGLSPLDTRVQFNGSSILYNVALWSLLHTLEAAEFQASPSGITGIYKLINAVQQAKQYSNAVVPNKHDQVWPTRLYRLQRVALVTGFE